MCIGGKQRFSTKQTWGFRWKIVFFNIPKIVLLKYYVLKDNSEKYIFWLDINVWRIVWIMRSQKNVFIFWMLFVWSQVKPIGLNFLNACGKKGGRKKDSDNKTCINFSLIHIYTQAVLYHASCARSFFNWGQMCSFHPT